MNVHTHKLHKLMIVVLFTSINILFYPQSIHSESEKDENEELSEYDLRLGLYKKTETLTQFPWYFIAAIDQYERNIGRAKDVEDRITNIEFPVDIWYGMLVDEDNDTKHLEETIDYFGGIGKDGNGNGIADHTDDEDVLYTAALFFKDQLYGNTFEEVLLDYYEHEKAAQIVIQIAKMYHHFQTVDLSERAFPIPKYHNYSYRSTWGDARGYGGRRIHEGTDIFASYGVPVRSASYGIVEIKGWNKFGGWRVGVRDVYGIYHYYAHLNGFEKGIEEGSFVKPGDVIGYVGASGYGPEGTSGKFPPHLHYGMYRFNGKHEWAFDPYPYLRRWERNR